VRGVHPELVFQRPPVPGSRPAADAGGQVAQEPRQVVTCKAADEHAGLHAPAPDLDRVVEEGIGVLGVRPLAGTKPDRAADPGSQAHRPVIRQQHVRHLASMALLLADVHGPTFTSSEHSG